MSLDALKGVAEPPAGDVSLIVEEKGKKMYLAYENKTLSLKAISGKKSLDLGELAVGPEGCWCVEKVKDSSLVVIKFKSVEGKGGGKTSDSIGFVTHSPTKVEVKFMSDKAEKVAEQTWNLEASSHSKGQFKFHFTQEANRKYLGVQKGEIALIGKGEGNKDKDKDKKKGTQGTKWTLEPRKSKK